jgi:hypothetical protein
MCLPLRPSSRLQKKKERIGVLCPILRITAPHVRENPFPSALGAYQLPFLPHLISICLGQNFPVHILTQGARSPDVRARKSVLPSFGMISANTESTILDIVLLFSVRWEMPALAALNGKEGGVCFLFIYAGTRALSAYWLDSIKRGHFFFCLSRWFSLHMSLGLHILNCSRETTNSEIKSYGTIFQPSVSIYPHALITLILGIFSLCYSTEF